MRVLENLLLALFVSSMLGGCGGDSGSPTSPTSSPQASNLTGTWQGSIRSVVVPGAFANISASLTQTGTNVSGTLSCSAGNVPCMFSTGTVTATVNGRSLSGRLAFQGGSCQTFNGTVSGDSASGDYACAAAFSSDSGTWSMTRR
jgi:hypothetical protein